VATDCECIVIGAGVIGLSIAAKLAATGREVLILESESAYGSVTSARNSEVIHAGIYYPADSLKARFCVSGREALYTYCRERHIKHRRCGKLIVATTDAQVVELEAIRQRAMINGVSDLCLLDQQQAQQKEPQLSCLAALHSPSTGIVDSHGLMLSILADAQNSGAVLALKTPVLGITTPGSQMGCTLEVGGEEPMSISAKWVINAAGHGACRLISSLPAPPEFPWPTPILSKGNYFSLQGKAPFSQLIYPIPEPGGLGVHITIDLAGQARFGPDVEPIEQEDYAVDSSRSQRFYSAIRRYWPDLPDDSLSADYSGIRPKLQWCDAPYTDFMITSESDHGISGLVNLFGIESPGLTSSFAIADYVEQLCR
jgi:L-2-hydroxyglutarate oxidase LhgO